MRREPAVWSPQHLSFSRDDGLPKYIAIARAIGQAITEEELKPGEYLPSQKELAESFGVTVMTVRQAIQLLIDQGKLSAEQGKGTYVQSRSYRLPMGPLASFAAQMSAAGMSLRTEVLGFGPIEISPLEQKRMGLPTAEAFELVRLRIVDGEPLVLQTSLLPPAVAAGITPSELETRSLYDVLHSELGIRIKRATETVQATQLDAESAGLLRRTVGEAALLSARLTFSEENNAVIDDRALTAGNRVVIAAEREAGDSPLLLQLSTQDTSLHETTPFVRGTGDHRQAGR